MRNEEWELLLGRIKDQKCTPFLGAGAAAGTLPLASQVAADWAKAAGYPLDDAHDLARVSQFIGVRLNDAMAPKERICELLADVEEPHFDAPEPSFLS
jgi:hypothetical protein